MEFSRMKDGEYVFCSEEIADFVTIPIEEYHGLQKALRIVRDRALQQVEKSKADKHGYRLLRADLRRFKDTRAEAWLVTKQTPYSVKIEPLEVLKLIAMDLDAFYSQIEYEGYMADYGEFVYFTEEDYCRARKVYKYNVHCDYLLENSTKGIALKKLFDAFDGSFVFGLNRLSANYGEGVYEISYWATNVL